MNFKVAFLGWLKRRTRDYRRSHVLQYVILCIYHMFVSAVSNFRLYGHYTQWMIAATYQYTSFTNKWEQQKRLRDWNTVKSTLVFGPTAVHSAITFTELSVPPQLASCSMLAVSYTCKLVMELTIVIIGTSRAVLSRHCKPQAISVVLDTWSAAAWG